MVNMLSLAMVKGIATFSTPLAITTLYHHPYLTAIGVALQTYLAKLTYTKLLNPHLISKQVEETAMASYVTTSGTNRLTRVLLGIVHVFAGASLAKRSQIDSNEEGEKSFNIFWQTINFCGILLLFSTAGTWISSGYYGQ